MTTRVPVTRRHLGVVGTWAVIIAALAVGRFLTDALPSTDAHERPFAVAGKVGQELSLRSGLVQVTSVSGAPTMTDAVTTYHTPGTFILVTYVFTPSSRSVGLGSARIRAADGTTWGTREAGRNQHSCAQGVPGLPLRCAMALDLPPDKAVGAHLLLSAQDDDRYDSRADVDLGITDADVQAWAATSEPVVPEPATVGRSPGTGS